MHNSNRHSEIPAAHSRNWFHGRRGEKPRSLRSKWWARACAAVVICAATAVALRAQSYTLLHSFAGPPNDGAYSWAGLAFDGEGNLYGTTIEGGTWNYLRGESRWTGNGTAQLRVEERSVS